jgi:diguanylate cyclase (GGDEF)-like protein
MTTGQAFMHDSRPWEADEASSAEEEILCITDSSGRLVAVDPEVEASDLAVGPKRRLLDQVIASKPFTEALGKVASHLGPTVDFVLSWPEGTPPPHRVDLRRLEGPTGPLILVRLRREPPAFTADPLTGLPDRRALAQRFTELQSAGGRRHPFAVLFADLDDFKLINDAHGHATGDRVLQEVASRMAGCVREHDLVVRYGGDEFVFLINDVASYEEVEAVAGRLSAAVSRPLSLPGGAARLDVTVGAALAEDDSLSLEQLIEAADQAMYARKKRAKPAETLAR